VTTGTRPTVVVAKRTPPERALGDLVRTVLRGVGQTLITVGVVLLLFCVYELWVTNLVTNREQAQLGNDLQRQWATAPTAAPGPRPVPVELGTGIAVLRIPRLGADYAKVVVEGTNVEDLKKGPGRMVGTANPGEVGNTVFSGHRTTYGAPFSQFDELRPGDAVVVETRDTWFTYRVTGSQIVAPDAIEVTYPVPGQRGAQPTERLLTMTTCNPKYSAAQRLIVSANLEVALAKSVGDPPALTAG